MRRASRESTTAGFDLSAATPIGGLYIAMFLVRGVASPFFPLWFQDRGYSSVQISMLLAIPAFAGLALGPLLALGCNMLVWRRTGLVVATAFTAMAFATLSICHGAGWSVYVAPVVWVVAIAINQAQLPLADVLALSAAKFTAPRYGQYRGLGTTAYMAANLAGGMLLSVFGSRFIATWCVAASLCGLLAVLTLPNRAWSRCTSPPREPPWRQLGELLRNRTFLAILFVAGLIECSHVYFYSFSSLIWRAEGAAPATIGELRAVCALAEVVFLFGLEAWAPRIGPWSLLLVGSAASVVRWTCMGMAPPVWIEFGLQALHALSYTATFVAALRLVERTLDRERFPLGQAVCAAFIGGFVPGIGTMFCGVLNEHMASAGYFVMAALAALAGLSTLRLRGRLILGSAILPTPAYT